MPRRPAVPDLIRIRPRAFTTAISRGRSALVTTLDGLVVDRDKGGEDHGFFVHETRLLSRWRYLIDGDVPQPTSLSAVHQNHWFGYYVAAAPGVTRPEKDQGSGQVPFSSQITLELRVTRVVDDGLHEDIDLTNFTMEESRFTFAIEVDADFLDPAEIGERQQHGTLDVRWDAEAARLTFDYVARNGDVSLHRSVEIAIVEGTAGVPPAGAGASRSCHSETQRRDAAAPAAGTAAVHSANAHYANGHLTFDVTIPPQARWHASVLVTPVIDGTRLEPPRGCYAADTDAPHEQAVRAFFEEGTQFESVESATRTADVIATLEQARSDLGALRLFDLDRAPRAWTVAAGLPLYASLFGRDTLTAGWQAGLIGADIMRGTLPVLADLQGTREDDWRDEQPGKMLHEAHTGPLAMLGLNPRARSYSSITTSGLYAFIVAELWHWTGDKDLVRPLVEPALRALQWLERYGDIDGDGFYEYKTRSPMGPRHHAWKDSPDAIVYEDGALVEPPIATSEEQAFVYVAKLHFAETLWWLGERDLSRRIYREAVELKKRFNDAFWMEDDGFFAMGLDAQKRPIRSISSNTGHCLATAIVDSSLVERTADRLFAPDLFSGWGIRTLSSDHPRYNPYSYHLGSIWPVEHGTFALGLMRYGLHDRVEQIARAQFEAAALFEFHRLPELFGGHPRDAQHPFPGIYPGANSPQAWSASAVFLLLQAMLGIYPYAPLKMLIIDPHLPEWLPEITLRSLRVGKARVTIRFRRHASGRTGYRILDKRGTLHVVRQPTPWSLTAQPAERLRDALASLLPRH